VLGVTFKENCPDVRNSRVFDVIHELQDWGVQVNAMDPWADPKQVQQEYGLQLEEITRIGPVDSLIVAVAHQEFENLTPTALRALCSPQSKPVIADLKSLYRARTLEEQGFEVFRL
jgi:UDP-N-acetyl-D-galactosamine dehydrogenase